MHKKWSLSIIFTLPLLLQLLVTVSLIGFFSYQAGRRSSLEFANQLRDNITSELQDKLDQYLKVPRLINQLNVDAIKRGELNLNLSQRNPQNEHYLWQMIQHFPGVSWISVGSEVNGHYLGVFRDNVMQMIVVNNATNRHTWTYWLDNNGEQISPTPNSIAPYQYDPRERPWYKTAAIAGKPVWSGIFQTPPASPRDTIFISASYPIYQKRQLSAVICVSYVLQDLEEFIANIELGNTNTGRTFIIERSGLLVASSTSERPFLLNENNQRTDERLHISQSKDPLINATAQFLRSRFENLDQITKSEDLEFVALDQKLLLQMVPYQDEWGLDWIIVTVVPEQDFLTPINQNAYETLKICVLALACSALVSWLITRWMTWPILLLNQAAQNLVQGQWESPLALNRKDELGELAQSFQLMSQQLKDAFENLELRVKSRTIDLERSNKKVQEKNRLLSQERNKLHQEIEHRKIVEEQLSQSQSFLVSILNYSHDGIIALEVAPRGFRCCVVNPLMANILRHSTDRLVGMIIPKRFFDRLDSNLFCQLLEVVETGYPLEKDIHHNTIHHQYWYRLTAVKLDHGIAITVRDITKQKQFELKLYNLAHFDGLTGIYNRRWFDEKLQSNWQTCLHSNQSIALILCDVDYFKRYNDHYGHQAGDDCLKQVAQALAQVLREDHHADVYTAARYGGEEFVLLFPGLDEQGAVQIAQRIQQAVHHLHIPHATSDIKAIVSLSLGISAIIPEEQLSPEYLIFLADQALYHAKHQGRNRYEISNPIHRDNHTNLLAAG